MTLYEKRGRRYVPVQDTDAGQGLPNGVWLVDVREGRTMTIRAGDEAASETIGRVAALPALIDIITDELREHSQARPARPLTPKERKAMEAFYAVMGDESTLTMTRPSAWDIAERVARALVAKTEVAKPERVATPSLSRSSSTRS